MGPQMMTCGRQDWGAFEVVVETADPPRETGPLGPLGQRWSGGGGGGGAGAGAGAGSAVHVTGKDAAGPGPRVRTPA